MVLSPHLCHEPTTGTSDKRMVWEKWKLRSSFVKWANTKVVCSFIFEYCHDKFRGEYSEKWTCFLKKSLQVFRFSVFQLPVRVRLTDNFTVLIIIQTQNSLWIKTQKCVRFEHRKFFKLWMENGSFIPDLVALKEWGRMYHTRSNNNFLSEFRFF